MLKAVRWCFRICWYCVWQNLPTALSALSPGPPQFSSEGALILVFEESQPYDVWCHLIHHWKKWKQRIPLIGTRDALLCFSWQCLMLNLRCSYSCKCPREVAGHCEELICRYCLKPHFHVDDHSELTDISLALYSPAGALKRIPLHGTPPKNIMFNSSSLW